MPRRAFLLRGRGPRLRRDAAGVPRVKNATNLWL
jgi:hypothetical protein